MASGTVSGNKVTVTLPSEYTAISGVGMLTMIITPTSGTVRPVNIRLVVQKAADGDDVVAGASDMPDRLAELAEQYYASYITQDVAQLRGDIEGITGFGITHIDEWVYGQYIDSTDGSASSDGATNWKRTDYVDVFPDLGKVKVTTSNATGSSIYNAWYDESESFISSFSFTKNGEAVLTPPSNARYMRLSCTSATNLTASMDYFSIFDSAQMMREGKDITDFNDVRLNGIYILWANKSYLHAPDGEATGAKHIMVYTDNTGYTIQKLYCTPNTNGKYKVYMRVSSNTGWKEWFKLYENELSRNMVESFTATARSAQSAANSGKKISVMTYNVAQYNNDTSTFINNEKILNFRNFLGKTNADIVCTQEDNGYCDSGNTMDSDDYIWYPIYPVRSGEGGVAIHSKMAQTHRNLVKHSNGKLMRFATIDVDGATLLIISAHTVWNYNNTGGESADSIASRKTQIEEMFQWINGDITLPNNADDTATSVPEHSHCVICIDANTATSTDKTNLEEAAEDASFILGNGGAVGWFYTCDFRKSSICSIDNIICSENVVINGITAYSDCYDTLYSDHVPVVAELTLLDSQ